jgi:5-methylcytosine-specific restriction endonuclease McrA
VSTALEQDEPIRPARGAAPSGPEAAAELRRRELKIEEKNRARCRRYGAQYVERVRLSMVYERDRGQCWLCGGQTLLHPPAGAVIFDRSGKQQALPHPELATLDHVVPLADRGDHSYANVRLAHYLCNAQNGRPPAEILRRLLEGVRASWETNAATAGRLTAIGYAAASLRSRTGSGTSRVHLVTQTEGGWLLACPPPQLYPAERMQQIVSPPTCRSCRTTFRAGR